MSAYPDKNNETEHSEKHCQRTGSAWQWSTKVITHAIELTLICSQEGEGGSHISIRQTNAEFGCDA